MTQIPDTEALGEQSRLFNDKVNLRTEIRVFQQKHGEKVTLRFLKAIVDQLLSEQQRDVMEDLGRDWR